MLIMGSKYLVLDTYIFYTSIWGPHFYKEWIDLSCTPLSVKFEDFRETMDLSLVVELFQKNSEIREESIVNLYCNY